MLEVLICAPKAGVYHVAWKATNVTDGSMFAMNALPMRRVN